MTSGLTRTQNNACMGEWGGDQTLKCSAQGRGDKESEPHTRMPRDVVSLHGGHLHLGWPSTQCHLNFRGQAKFSDIWITKWFGTLKKESKAPFWLLPKRSFQFGFLWLEMGIRQFNQIPPGYTSKEHSKPSDVSASERSGRWLSWPS